jgi:hypothetical protein
MMMSLLRRTITLVQSFIQANRSFSSKERRKAYLAETRELIALRLVETGRRYPRRGIAGAIPQDERGHAPAVSGAETEVSPAAIRKPNSHEDS